MRSSMMDGRRVGGGGGPGRHGSGTNLSGAGVGSAAAAAALRRQRSLEWRRGDSSSDDELPPARPAAPAVDQHVFASLLAQAQQQFSDDVGLYRNDVDTDDGNVTTDGPTTPFPTPPPSGVTNIGARQSSPFPVESTNRQQRLAYGAGARKLSATQGSGTLTRGTGGAGRRHRPSNNAPTGMTSSSSATSCNSCATDQVRNAGDYLQDDPRQQRLCLSSDMNEESPPEPAPPEVPPRGPSLHAAATLRRRQEYAVPIDATTASAGSSGNEQDPPHFMTQDYLMSGGNSGSYGPRSPLAAAPAPTQINSQQPQQTQQHRLTSSVGQTSTLSGSCGGQPQQLGGTQPLVMPVFPLRSAHQPHTYSPYSPSRFHIDKRCQHRCSWKCLAIVMMVVAVALTAMLAYFAAVSSMKPNIMDSSNCILVQDAVTHDQVAQDSASTAGPTEESVPTASTQDHRAIPSVTAQQNELEHQSAQQTQIQQHQQNGPNEQQQHLLQQLAAQQWPPVLELREMNVPHRAAIPPYQFWNSEFRNKQPTFIRLNFTLPWGANFAVYGRRNVAPSVTQYDFVEFIKGGRLDHKLRKRDTTNDDPNTKRTHRDQLKFIYRNSERHKTDILDTISNSYDGTRKILSDSEPRGPFFVPHDTTSSAHLHHPQEEESFTEPPRPTVDIGVTFDEHVISKRSTLDEPMMVNVSLLQYLDTGRWFLSVYNDELRPHTVIMVIVEAEGVSTACPNECSGRGSCYLGKCDCIDGFQGIDCSKSVCPILCSAHGQYGGGVCHCEDGWKGAECDVPEHDCRVPDCSGRGRCVEGQCLCKPGWRGEGCEEVDCLDPTCSGHGACVLGRCYCKAGWQGENCSTIDEQVHRCLPSCNDHGQYDLETAQCICDRHWSGPDCSRPVCSIDCGAHGRCDSGRCRCDPGWTGERCELLPCDPRCSEHGQCKNGTCVCSQGWNGRHCTLPGCENGCSRHGQCTLESGTYRCVCIDGWAGTDCSIPLEMNCNDDVDNDHDGMTDCSDSECCSHKTCADHIMCLASNDPVEVLLRKQPPSVTASFYQRVKFLIEENSVQSYAHMDEYSESRVAVMRGQVVTAQGIGIVGIRVSVDRDSRFGFTLTRQGGWFDVLVNGGGAVTLQFQRSPFRPLTRTVYVPWNQIVVLPPIHMELVDTETNLRRTGNMTASIRRDPAIDFPGVSRSLFVESSNLPVTCHDHNPNNVYPIITGTWMPESVGGLPGRSLVFAESQVVQESIPIPGSDLNLVYRSSHAPGYLSAVHMKLTGATVPETLTHVHVRVEVEGSLHVRTYEADPNLTHVFAWNKRNVYKQKVYGVAVAKISIGYKHLGCAEPVWETRTATLQGFDVDISDIGGWGLDVHHHYNFHEGILQKGDGTTLHLKQYPRTVKVVMGTGIQRPLVCPGQCGGPAKDARLLTPGALAAGPDGSLYVGDFNLVRRITPDGKVYTVLQLSTTQVAYQYYLTVSPADGHLYVSDPEKHQILRVLNLDPVQDPSINSEPVVGSGERCIPGDETNCGDEGPALKARLAHPKGLAIAADKTMYIADGTNIRAVDPKGFIHTLVGHHGHHGRWTPTPCRGAIPAQQAQLQWPTGLALSPLDGALHFIDDRLILKLTADMKVQLVAGTPLHCYANADGKNDTISEEDITKKADEILGTVLSLSFSPYGDLYLAESDSRKVNFVRVVDSAGRMTLFAGHDQDKNKQANCECNSTITTSNPKQRDVAFGCSCGKNEETINNAETLLSSNAKFQSISAITVAPDGVLYIADQGSLHILALEHYLPTHDESGEFHIPYPPTGEIYVFNRYGQHVATKDLASGKTIYSFLYSKNTSFGKLSTVTDSTGNKIQFLRDYSNVVSSIENTQDHKSELKISGVGYLTKLSEKGRSEIELEYDSTTGLLTSRSGGTETFIYRYDWLGRANGVTLPSGETLTLSSTLDSDGLQVQVDTPPTRIIIQDRHEKIIFLSDDNKRVTQAASFGNSTMYVNTAWGGRIETAAIARHPLLEAALPVEAEMLPVWSHQVSTFGDGLENHMKTTFSLVGDVKNPQQTLNREIWINDSRVLGIEYDQFTSTETFYDRDRITLLTISFDPAGLPRSYVPMNGAAAPVNVSYDRFNRLESWKWGPAELRYTYDRRGLLTEVTSAQDGSTIYSYDDLNALNKITLASQRSFTLGYDDDGGLRHVILPSGTRHAFSVQPSIGFIRATYTPPGSAKSYLQHYSYDGRLLQTVFPGDGARVVYRYTPSGQLSELVHGDGRSQFIYSPGTGSLSQVLHTEKELEYRWDYQHVGGLLFEERLDFGAKTGLSNAKFTYDYDNNYRLLSVQGRIGGQNLPQHNLEYDPRSGALTQIGSFKISRQKFNETIVYDGTAIFSRTTDGRFLETQIAVTIHRMEVFRMEFAHDTHGRISQTRTNTKNVGVSTYTNTKNYTWDCDGQLSGVEAQEPWGFRYDDNGNMLSLTYRGNTIPMEYNAMDRIVKFGEGVYKYDNRGLVVQNAREERFHYNAKGLLVRATKRGRFDVRYYYDHMDRLTTRKDNYGNVTQFFYTNQNRPREVSHIYSPRDGKLMTLLYDDRGHLIFAQVYRHKYYVATDQCGTPVMIFNQYGEGIREIMRSPYGHIVYDSNPYLYLPVDFCGGLLDQVTSLVHMPNGNVYDPLIGQWMTPLWRDVVKRVSSPTHLHLYRFNGNDPINVRQTKEKPTDYSSWLSRIGYNLQSLAPQLYPENFPGGAVPPTLRGVDLATSKESPVTSIESGFLAQLTQRRASDWRGLSAPSRSSLKANALDAVPKRIGAATDPPFGRGILVSRTNSGRAVVTSVLAANAIYKDVYTSVFNNTLLLPFTFVVHNSQQDAYYFVKEDAWKSAEDRAQLKRLQGQVNATFHEIAKENGSGANGNYLDVKIHGAAAVINLRYGTTADKEKQRLLHHAKLAAVRKAWHREKESLRNGFPGSIDWSAQEIDEIIKDGAAKNYDGEYVHSVQLYPELAEDPFNIRFVKRQNSIAPKRRKKRSSGVVTCTVERWWFQWNPIDC